MKTQPEHSIEPLSDAAWQRIEATLFERLAAQPPEPVHGRRVWLTGFLVAAGVLLGTLSALHRLPSKPEHAALRHLSAGPSEQSFSLPGVSLRLAPRSTLDCELGAADTLLCKLALGDALFDVAPRHGRAPLVVVAGDVRVEVVGTVFRVALRDGVTSVETYEGTVRVSARGQQVLVQRGQRWPAPPGPQPPIIAVESTPTAQAAPVQIEPARAPGPRARFEEAAACEATDSRRAAQLYEQLAREAGPWASNGLFALGRLELERGQKARAERHLRRYLQLYPGGANALDARALLERMASGREAPESRP